MIDVQNASYIKLSPWDPADAVRALDGILIPGERVHLAFRGIRDSVTFTSKRVVALNVQGMTGEKKDVTSLPYSRIQAFSVETAGTVDLDSELELWFSGLDKVKLEFASRVDIRSLGHLISDKVLCPAAPDEAGVPRGPRLPRCGRAGSSCRAVITTSPVAKIRTDVRTSLPAVSGLQYH